MSNPVVILGGSGFIGTRMCSEMKPGEFRILDKKKSADFPDNTDLVDIMDRDRLTELLHGTKCVVNLAAEHKDDVSPVSLYQKVNVEGAQILCDACEKNGVERIVFTSSVAVYGLNKENPDESHPTDPFNPYGKSKLAAEEVYIKWQKSDPENRSLVIVRPTVVFGEGNRGNVYNLLKQIATRRFIKIGKGINKKSMAYVGNMSAFLIYSIKSGSKDSQVYNYVDKPDLSISELVEICESTLDQKVPNVSIPYPIGLLAGYGFDILSKISGKSFSVSSVRVKKFCAVTQFDGGKVHSIGFKAPYSLKRGLDATLKYEFKK